MKELRPPKKFKVKIEIKLGVFSPHGLWARFVTNVLKCPKLFRGTIKTKYRSHNFPLYSRNIPDWAKKETEAALDKLCNDRKS